MFQQVDYVMITVSDMSRSIGFYRELIGLAVKVETPEWSEFQTGTTTLALHGGGARPEASNEAKASQPAAGTCSIGFNVEDVQRTFDEMSAKGVKFVMPPIRREGEGIILCVCVDPDGLPISFAQTLEKK